MLCYVRPSKKKLDVSRPRPLPFLLPPPFFYYLLILIQTFILLYLSLKKMYIQLSNSFGHGSAESILPYENCSYSTATRHRPKLDVLPEIWDILYARYAIEQLRFKSEYYGNHFYL